MGHQGEALRVVLTRNNVKISDLAERLKVSRTTIYTWFDMTLIPYENLERMSEALNLDMFELIRQEMGLKSLKKYQPVESSTSESDERSTYGGEKIQVNVELDGSDATFDRMMAKLRALNQALADFSAAI